MNMFLFNTGFTRRNTVFHIRVAASQEYVNTYSTCRLTVCLLFVSFTGAAVVGGRDVFIHTALTVCPLFVSFTDAVGVVLVVCVSVSGVLFSVGVCVCDLLIFLHEWFVLLSCACACDVLIF